MALHMAPSLSLRSGGTIQMDSEFRDSFSLLDVLYANQFEEQPADAEDARQVEMNFYRGAPPQWQNFHLADVETTPLIKRDGYNELVQQIKKERNCSMSSVVLKHQPGSGGTTLAMQVLWSFRKSLRCAALTGSTFDSRAIAQEVIRLFTAGIQDRRNTVLLLLDNMQVSESLQHSITAEMLQQGIDPDIPVVVLLNCVRKDSTEACPTVFLQKKLSDVEKQKFQEKRTELCQRYKDENEHFHGFNIMQTDFSNDYVQAACLTLKDFKIKGRPQKKRFISFLSLLNAYVPGSYLLECQCQEYLGDPRQDPIHGGPSFAERIAPFAHLLVIYRQKVGPKYETVVRMAHPMMAKECTRLIVKAGETRSHMATTFLRHFCRYPAPSYLVLFVKKMLTKRGKQVESTPTPGEDDKVNRSIEKDQEKFSELILNIKQEETPKSCILVLKTASTMFHTDAFFPQALARFYDLEMQDYSRGEYWAKMAKMRAPSNSFIADTLGQVYKHQLYREIRSSKPPISPRKILDLAEKGLCAFEEEEKLSENTFGTDMRDDGLSNTSSHFNYRGLFGFIHIANMIYDVLVRADQTWRDVLTKRASKRHLVRLLEANKVLKYKDFINSLRNEVERKYVFFQSFLTYSKPYDQYEPPYVLYNVLTCYLKYVGMSAPSYVNQKTTTVIQQLKQTRAITYPELLTSLDRRCTEEDLTRMKTRWIEVFQTGHPDQVAVDDEYVLGDAHHNCILAHIMLHHYSFQKLNDLLREKKQEVLGSQVPREAPELYMLLCLLLWPTGEEESQSQDISKLIALMASSYENNYKRYLRARYLRPLLFLGKGQDLSKVVPRKILEDQIKADQRPEEGWIKDKLSNDQIFKDPRVENLLLKVHGVVQNHRVYARVMGQRFEVGAHLPASVWRSGPVSFYVGFNIQGPLAFGIQYINTRPTEEEA